jgi:PBP1b-binding outer membrane lipoprotein LpoB
MKIIISIIAFVFLLTSCSSKIEFGKQCTQDGKVYSYVWFKQKPVTKTIMFNNCDEALEGK